MRFACRTCRKEVTLNEDGSTQHLDGSPACVFEIAGNEMAGWDRHEVLEDGTTLNYGEDISSQLEGEEKGKKRKGKDG